MALPCDSLCCVDCNVVSQCRGCVHVFEEVVELTPVFGSENAISIVVVAACCKNCVDGPSNLVGSSGGVLVRFKFEVGEVVECLLKEQQVVLWDGFQLCTSFAWWWWWCCFVVVVVVIIVF